MTTRLNLLITPLILLAGTGHAAETSEASPVAASVDVIDLRCEYLKDPLGIDVQHPRLSWRLTAKDPAARGLHQTSYRVLVSSSLQRLASSEGDLWDSGNVASGESAHVVYAGTPLASRGQCFWKVRVCDQAGVPSAWSQPAYWSLGLLDAADWQAKWIGADAVHVRQKGWPIPDNTMPDPWFRKRFVLDAAPARAMLYVASIGYHEVYVNGRKVGDTVLAPCTTNHKKRARYCTYDIAGCLKPGANVLGLWLGTSWSLFPPYKSDDKPASPLVLAKAEVELPGASRLCIATDATWRTRPARTRCWVSGTSCTTAAKSTTPTANCPIGAQRTSTMRIGSRPACSRRG